MNVYLVFSSKAQMTKNRGLKCVTISGPHLIALQSSRGANLGCFASNSVLLWCKIYASLAIKYEGRKYLSGLLLSQIFACLWNKNRVWASLEITVGPDWAKFRPFGNLFQKVYLVFGKMEIPLCQNGDSVLANFYSFWANVYCCKGPTIEKIIWLRLWLHWTSTFPLSIYLSFYSFFFFPPF